MEVRYFIIEGGKLDLLLFFSDLLGFIFNIFNVVGIKYLNKKYFFYLLWVWDFISSVRLSRGFFIRIKIYGKLWEKYVFGGEREVMVLFCKFYEKGNWFLFFVLYLIVYLIVLNEIVFWFFMLY